MPAMFACLLACVSPVEINIVLIGVVLQLGNVATETTRQALVQILLQVGIYHIQVATAERSQRQHSGIGLCVHDIVGGIFGASKGGAGN